MNMLSPATLDQLVTDTVDEVLRIVDYLIESSLEGGRVWGDRPDDPPGEVISRYVDLADTGALEMLPVVSPEVAGQQQRDFERAMRRQIEAGVQ